MRLGKLAVALNSIVNAMLCVKEYCDFVPKLSGIYSKGISVLAIGFLPLLANAATLNAGQVFEYGFNSLPYSYSFEPSDAPPNQAGITVWFGSDALDSGDEVKLELFENSFSDGVLISNVFDMPTTTIGYAVPYVWQDFQGLYRLTVLSGSVSLDHSWFRVIQAGSAYEQSFSHANAVPAPPAFILMLTGLGLLGLTKRFRKAYKEA